MAHTSALLLKRLLSPARLPTVWHARLGMRACSAFRDRRSHHRRGRCAQCRLSVPRSEVSRLHHTSDRRARHRTAIESNARPRTRMLHALQGLLRPARRPFKRSHLVALRTEKIIAGSPPSTRWPGERWVMPHTPGWAIELDGEQIDLKDLRPSLPPPLDPWVEDYATDDGPRPILRSKTWNGIKEVPLSTPTLAVS
jgi:hypothetical protein